MTQTNGARAVRPRRSRLAVVWVVNATFWLTRLDYCWLYGLQEQRSKIEMGLESSLTVSMLSSSNLFDLNASGLMQAIKARWLLGLKKPLLGCSTSLSVINTKPALPSYLSAGLSNGHFPGLFATVVLLETLNVFLKPLRLLSTSP